MHSDTAQAKSQHKPIFFVCQNYVGGGGNRGCLDDSFDTQATEENHKHDALIKNPCWQVRNQSSLAQSREDEHFNASGFHPGQLTPHTAYCSPKAINHSNKCHFIHRSGNHKNENEKWLRKKRGYHFFHVINWKLNLALKILENSFKMNGPHKYVWRSPFAWINYIAVMPVGPTLPGRVIKSKAMISLKRI